MQETKQMGPAPKSPNQNADPTRLGLAARHSVYHDSGTPKKGDLMRALLDVVSTIYNPDDPASAERVRTDCRPENPEQMAAEAVQWLENAVNAILGTFARHGFEQGRRLIRQWIEQWEASAFTARQAAGGTS